MASSSAGHRVIQEIRLCYTECQAFLNSQAEHPPKTLLLIRHVEETTRGSRRSRRAQTQNKMYAVFHNETSTKK